jgi:hypothetical protein
MRFDPNCDDPFGKLRRPWFGFSDRGSFPTETARRRLLNHYGLRGRRNLLPPLTFLLALLVGRFASIRTWE